MHALLRHALRVTVLSGGLLVAGAAAAHADDGLLDDDTTLDGLVEDVVADNVVTAPVTAPIDLGDVTATVLGDTDVRSEEVPAAEAVPTSTVEITTDDASAGDEAPTELPEAAGTAVPAEPAEPAPTTDPDEPIALDVVADNTATLPITAPVTAGDPVVTVGGTTDVERTESGVTAPAAAPTSTTSVDAPAAPAPADDAAISDVVADNTVTAPVTVPVDVGDITATVLGETTIDETVAPSDGDTETTGSDAPVSTTTVDAPAAPAPADDAAISDVVADNTVTAPVTVPVDVGDITATVLGETTVDTTETPAAPAPVSTTTVDTSAQPVEAAPVDENGDSGPVDGLLGDLLGDGLLSDVVADNTVTAPITVPVTVGDLSLSLLGDTTIDRTAPAATTGPVAPVSEVVVTQEPGSDAGSSGSLIEDVLSGNVITLPITVPIDVGDPTVTIIGETEIVDEVTPTDPTDPVDPVDPTDPTDPVDPVDPTDPTDPSDPTDPVDPVDPTDPTNPSDPGTDPGNGPDVDATTPVVVEVVDHGTTPQAPATDGSANAGSPVNELPETGAGASLPLAALAGGLIVLGLLTRKLARV
ncbi:chaplin family protein [Georgenia sp. Z1344]|uniref:chaplin family protein n=1 Tax=Georgenia sp. Z1344 TaxID=3416706 RepID=UPI003CED23AB